MNPHQQNKVDISVSRRSIASTPPKLLTHFQSLSPEEQRLFRLYGKMPNKKDVLQNKLKVSYMLPPSSLHSHRCLRQFPLLSSPPRCPEEFLTPLPSPAPGAQILRFR